MGNIRHRRLADGNLHSPERMGRGNPNDLNLDYLVDGQYFQDTLTGSVYRYYEDGNEWELILGYNRDSNKITNFTTGFQTRKIGELSAAIGTDDEGSVTITSIPAYIYTQVRLGEEIIITSVDDSERSITLTVSADTNAGEVNIPVQAQITRKLFNAGSSIELDGNLFSAYSSVDPTKVQLAVEREKKENSLGSVANFISQGSTITSVALVNVSKDIELKNGQSLILVSPNGYPQGITVSGNQTLNSPSDSITIQEITTQHPHFPETEGFGSFVYEPGYETFSRITLTENSITLQASQISGLSSAVASIDLRVDSVETDVGTLNSSVTTINNTLSTNGITGATNITSRVSSVEGDVSSINAEIVLKADVNGNISAVRLDADADGSNISITADNVSINNIDFNSAAGTIGSSNYDAGLGTGWQIQGNGDAYFNEIHARGGNYALNPDGGNIAGWVIDANTLKSADTGQRIELNKGNGRVGIFDSSNVEIAAMGYLGGLPKNDGSATNWAATNYGFWARESSYLVIDGDLQYDAGDWIIENDGLIKSSNYVSGSTGFQIRGTGDAELNNITARGTIVNGTASISGGVPSGTGTYLAPDGRFFAGNSGNGLYADSPNGDIYIYNYSFTDQIGAKTLYSKHDIYPNTSPNRAALWHNTSFSDGGTKKWTGFVMGSGGNGDVYISPHADSGTEFDFVFSSDFIWSRANQRWQFDDDLYVGGTFTNPSDQRYKENIEPIENALDKLMTLQAVRYDMKDFMVGDDDRKMLGLFAQEVEVHFPEAVVDGIIYDENEVPRDLKSLSYTQIVPVLVKAIQELNAKIDALS